MLDILSIDWEKKLDNNDVNKSFNNFLHQVNSVVDRYMPLKKITNKEYKRKYKPWISTGILKSITRKNELFKRYVRCKNNLIKNQKYEEYRVLKNNLNEIINNSKKMYYEKYFINNNNNLRKIWKGIKEIINIKSKNYDIPTCIQVENNIITDPLKICNSFNEYFTSIADDILKERKYEGNKTFNEFLKTPLPNSFVYEPCDPMEVKTIIAQLNVSKATGPNGVPTKILHLINNEVCKPLSKIYNLAVMSETHPEKLKFVNAIPIHKKGSRILLSNYRPISLLSNLNKIFEKIIFKRLYNFLEKYNCIYELQYGFRAKHSTTHALINITERIRDALDNNKPVSGVFVDLQKAFDTVNHSILLSKLEHYGIRGPINGWFKSYLYKRKQSVIINGYESDIQILNHGVPQGSVLGPLLFLLYINDLHISIQNSNVYHFADDTNLLRISTSYNKLQKELNSDLKNLNHWLLANKISLNETKTEIIHFHKINKYVPNNLKIKMNGKVLYPSDYIKYLGIYLDETLSGKIHCEELTKKLNRANGILAKSRHYVPSKQLKDIYYAIFSSHLTYGSQIWGQGINTYIDKIFIIQKNALRIISFSEFNAHTDPLFKKLKILKIKDLITLQNCLFVHDFINNKLPKSFNNTFNKLKDVHTINTRSAIAGNLYVPFSNTTRYGLNSIYRKSIDNWNFFVKHFKDKILSGLSRNNYKQARSH